MLPTPDAILPACHVLVLGAGLAGLTAATAAGRANPAASVVLACPSAGPTGSSFRNRNNRLGIHAPRTDAEKAAFAADVLRLGHPGRVDADLVAVLASEAADRLDELLALGVTVLRDPDGTPSLFPSCFAPLSRRAVLIEGLAAVYDRLAAAARKHGVTTLPGYTAASLVRLPNGRVVGAVLARADGGPVFQPAGAVIAAMGGPVPLFARHMAGPGNPGCGHGLLAEAGATLANTSFLQWMWSLEPSGAFWPVAALADQGWQVLDPKHGAPRSLPSHLAALAAGRDGHCPYGNGLADAALDAFALEAADPDGNVGVLAPDGTRHQVRLVPQAGNGGALIDADGRTSLPGLFAAGECATGMHGANRLGGAMVAACLVFGRRAGLAAAAEAAGNSPDHPAGLDAGKAALAAHLDDAAERDAVRHALGQLLTAKACPGRAQDRQTLSRQLAALLDATADTLARRAVQAAVALAER